MYFICVDWIGVSIQSWFLYYLWSIVRWGNDRYVSCSLYCYLPMIMFDGYSCVFEYFCAELYCFSRPKYRVYLNRRWKLYWNRHAKIAWRPVWNCSRIFTNSLPFSNSMPGRSKITSWTYCTDYLSLIYTVLTTHVLAGRITWREKKTIPGIAVFSPFVWPLGLKRLLWSFCCPHHLSSCLYGFYWFITFRLISFLTGFELFCANLSIITSVCLLVHFCLVISHIWDLDVLQPWLRAQHSHNVVYF